MKKTSKNLIISTLAISTLLLAGCNKGNTTPPSKEKEFTISLSDEELNLTIGDYSKLIASNSYNDTTLSVSWESTNPIVASVNTDGKIEALCDGEAYVIAKCNDASAACKVTVSKGFYLPVLEFVNEVDTLETICKGDELNLATTVSFNGRKFTDASIEYTLSNPLAGSIFNNKFVSGENSGVGTDIEIKATWRNFSTPTLTKVIHVDIVPIGQIIVNEGELSDVHLYTTDKIGEKTYKNIQPITSITGNYDGEEKEVESVELINNKSFDDPGDPSALLDYDPTTHTGSITGLKEGTAELKITLAGGYSQTFNVEIDLPYLDYETVIPYFSINDGLYYDADKDAMTSLADLFPTGNKQIVKAYQGDRKLTVVDNKLTNVVADTVSSMKETNVVIYNNVMAYGLTIQTYSKIVSSISDFNDIIFSSGTAKTINGYYYLVKNLDALASPLEMIGNLKVNSFGGVFDGGGHYVSAALNRTNVATWGLFGNQLKGTVKNVAFKNCQAQASNAGLLAEAANNGSLENVYLNVAVNATGRDNTPVMGAFVSTYGSLTCRQVIIDIPQELKSHYSNAQFYCEGALAIHRVTATVDLYIVSPSLIGGRIITDDPSKTASQNMKSYITQSEANADTAFIASGGTQHILTANGSKVYKYNSVTELKNSGNSFSNFDSTYWDLAEGYPRFKGTF